MLKKRNQLNFEHDDLDKNLKRFFEYYIVDLSYTKFNQEDKLLCFLHFFHDQENTLFGYF